MAWYIDDKNVKTVKNKDTFYRYEDIWKPGQKPDYPGIYRCQSCGFEDVINRGCEKVPPCSNCKEKGHTDNEWKLLVRAENAD